MRTTACECNRSSTSVLIVRPSMQGPEAQLAGSVGMSSCFSCSQLAPHRCHSRTGATQREEG